MSDMSDILFNDKNPWEWNVENCSVPVERAVMISDNPSRYNACYDVLEAGMVLVELGITLDQAQMHGCGKWFWFEFIDEADALAFKLRWT